MEIVDESQNHTEKESCLNIFYLKGNFDDIKSKYILKQIIEMVKEKISLGIIKYNKKIQERLEKTIQDYKDQCKIELEVKPKKN